MATNKYQKLKLLAVALVGSLLVLLATRYLHDRSVVYPKSTADFADNRIFHISPETILADLKNGSPNVFEPIEEIPEEDPSGTNSVFAWSQSDYVLVANSMHEFVLNQDVNNWNVYAMTFNRLCTDDPKGFHYADITYLKYDDVTRDYTFLETAIYPNISSVIWGGGEGFDSPLFGWKNIDLSRLAVTADQALQIAEDDGGAEFRAKVENKCKIYLILKPNTSYGKSWLVLYSTANPQNEFKLFIDSFTQGQ